MVDTSSQSDKPLIVYKASAGSGKTFTLAVEYITLLIKNPMCFRNILAVTFTNKATEEMKQRILSQLYGIANSAPDSDSYFQRIKSDTGLGDQLIRTNAAAALSILLHHYSEFRVETIDAFFQSVFRNLARELNLTANLKIELDTRQIGDRAIDNMIEDMDATSPVLRWLMEFIMEKIEDDKSWNVIRTIKTFGQTIFKDYYKDVQDQLEDVYKDPDFHHRFKQQLRDQKKDALEIMKQIAESFFDILDQEGLEPTCFKSGTRGISSFFNKLRNGTLSEDIINKTAADCLDDPANWVTKTNPNRTMLLNLVREQLMPILQFAISSREEQYKKYKSADLTLDNLNQLRLLHSISQKVEELNTEENKFLLSSTQDFLHQLIATDDAPFIFEKIGTQLENIMIDEFQDTSTIQWSNFKVLMNECLSHNGSRNLIVGDVKQSIYRWRSGDWQLLNNIDKQFDHYEQIAAEPPIDTNYRSLPHIINFNNHFFELAAETEARNQEELYPDGAQELRHAYAQVKQKWPASKPEAGMVSITLLNNKKDNANNQVHDNNQVHTDNQIDDNNNDDVMLKRTADIINNLLEAGIKPSGIAILLRNNKNIIEMADYLQRKLSDSISLVSDLAFQLNASQAVCLLIHALHLLTHPDDRLALATVMKTYQMDIMHTDEDLNHWMSTDDMYHLLPEEYTAHREQLRAMPLYDLTEHLFCIFHLEKLQEQGAYLCTFFDKLSQFITDNTADIDLLVKQWDDSLCKETIQSDDTDGIRLLSIHKSKGLEFDNVIIPYCDWKMEKNDSLWCKPTQEPYNQLPIVPVNFSAAMIGTVYEKDYLHEHLQNCVDNLNMLYVAFTRASHNLFVIGKQKSKSKSDSTSNGSRSILIERVLPSLAKDLNAQYIDDPIEFTYGELYVPQEKTKKESSNIFLQHNTLIKPAIMSIDNAMSFRQSNQSKDFIDGDDEQGNQLTYIQLGNVLHEIFSTIHTRADVNAALNQLQEQGILYDDQLTMQRITTMLHKRFENPQIADWFSSKWQLFNECTILCKDKKTGAILERRPDRVMMNDNEIIIVDFKFAKQKEEHQDQVNEYRQLIAHMGYQQPIHCYLWYVYPNHIIEVK